MCTIVFILGYITIFGVVSNHSASKEVLMMIIIFRTCLVCKLASRLSYLAIHLSEIF